MSDLKAREAAYDVIVAAAQKVSNAKDEFLRREGWEWTCQTPGSHWMWSKKLADGRTLLLTKASAWDTAVAMLGDEINRARQPGEHE